MLAALLLAAAAALPLASHHSVDEPTWTPIVAYDEVRVEIDTARVLGRGPYTSWVRWHYLERAASPSAWDAGIRVSLDLLEVDCDRAETRTLSSTAYAKDGTMNPAMSVDEPAAAWRAVRPGTVGAEIAAKVCRAGRTRP